MQGLLLSVLESALSQHGAAVSRQAAAVTDSLLPALCAVVADQRIDSDMRFSCLKVLSDVTAVLLQGAHVPCCWSAGNSSCMRTSLP